MASDPRAHLPDWSKPIDGHAPSLGHVTVGHRLPSRGKHVGEVYEPVVDRPLGHLDWSEMGLRNTQVLGLSTGNGTVELGVTEERGAFILIDHLRSLALRKESLVAHEAPTAGDVEGNDNSISRLYVRHLCSHFLDDAYGLMAEDVTFLHVHPEHFIEVEIGAAYATRGDSYDRVRGLFDYRVGDLLYPQISPSMPSQRSHTLTSFGRPPEALVACSVDVEGAALGAQPKRITSRESSWRRSWDVGVTARSIMLGETTN